MRCSASSGEIAGCFGVDLHLDVGDVRHRIDGQLQIAVSTPSTPIATERRNQNEPAVRVPSSSTSLFQHGAGSSVIVARAGLFDVGFDEIAVADHVARCPGQQPSEHFRVARHPGARARACGPRRRRPLARRRHRDRGRSARQREGTASGTGRLGDGDEAFDELPGRPRAVRVVEHHPRGDALARCVRRSGAM